MEVRMLNIGKTGSGPPIELLLRDFRLLGVTVTTVSFELTEKSRR